MQQQQQQSEVTNNTNINECSELKNIKYKSMLLSGVQETKTTSDINNLDQFLENEKTNNKSEPWSKLDKTYKTIKMLKFIETYKEEQKMTDEEVALLTAFLKDCLDRKRLSRVKDVVYDKTTGLIKDIPSLHYNKSNKHFTLKSADKRISTLKSLPPKKVRCTVKNTTTATQGEDSDEEDA